MKLNYLGKTLLVEVAGRKILVVGDLHLGYEESLNLGGIYISKKMFDEMIEEFDKILENAGKIDEIVLLGDVKHEFGRVLRQEWNDVLKLFDYLKKYCRKVIVIRGNHDKLIDSIISKRDFAYVKDNYCVESACFLHGDKDFQEIYNKEIKIWIIGHGHPAIKLSDPKGAKIEKYKCFLEGKYKDKKVIVVPSFFSYNVGSDPRENDLGIIWKIKFDKFKVKIVGENLEVFDFGVLGKLKI